MVPTVRSAIMIGVYELAVLLDREEEVFASLTLAALLIALVWPAVIADISFQLSFLAVLFIVWGMRKIHEWFPIKKSDELPQEKSWFGTRLSTSCGMHLAVPVLATLGTGPLIAHYFGHLSLAGFVANPVDRATGRFCRRAVGSRHRASCRSLRPELGLVCRWLLRRNCCPLPAWLVDIFWRAYRWLILACRRRMLGKSRCSTDLLLGTLALRKKIHLGRALALALFALGASWRLLVGRAPATPRIARDPSQRRPRRRGGG